MTYPSDVLDCVGFLRSDVWPLLAKGGIDAPLVLPTAKQDRPDCPEWMHVMALLPTLSETEAASAFAGVDLQAPGYRSDEEMAEVTRWETVLCRAIRAQAIPAKAVTFDKDGYPSEWSITPADLAAWCVAKRVEYPLPTHLSLPTTDAGLREALVQCDQERAQWKAKAEKLAAADDECSRLQAEIERLRGDLRTKSDELAAVTVQRDQMKAEALGNR